MPRVSTSPAPSIHSASPASMPPTIASGSATGKVRKPLPDSAPNPPQITKKPIVLKFNRKPNAN
jgi:hypothetical protein